MAAPLTLDNPFWTFSLKLYAAPGVEAECLALQQRYDIDVNVLLLCAWIGTAKQTMLTDTDLGAIDAVVTPWREAVVQNLRASRQALKVMPEMAHGEVAQLRKDIAALELRAEQIEQALLYRWAATIPRGAVAASEAVRGNVACLLQHCGGSEKDAAHVIAAALGA